MQEGVIVYDCVLMVCQNRKGKNMLAREIALPVVDPFLSLRIVPCVIYWRGNAVGIPRNKVQ